MIAYTCRAICRLTGFKAGLLAFIAGGLAAAALPPVYAVPGLLLAFPILTLLISSRPRGWSAFALGWSFGFGYFLAGLYWLGFAFLVDIERHAWMLPFAVSIVPAGLALFVALGVGLSARIRNPYAQTAAITASWVLGELLRGYILTGFPWNLLGYVWGFSPPMMQAAGIAGVYGLSLATVLAAVAFTPLLRQLAAGKACDRAGFAFPIVAFAFLAMIYGYGQLRLSQAPRTAMTDIELLLVQPNIPQHLKWVPEQRRQHLTKLMDLSASEDTPGARFVVIWPETALPFAADSATDLLPEIARRIAGAGHWLTGALHIEAGENKPAFYNSLIAVDGVGGVLARYDKVHLVPFGEYLPWRWLLQTLGLEGLAAGQGDFTPGPAASLLHLPGLPTVQPLICYEVIFPHEIGRPERPDWLLNITNDAWFGTSSGPYQHFVIAQARAIEQGAPLVRAANTGISGIVDAYGRTLNQIQLNEAGSIRQYLPSALPSPPFYQQSGDLPITLISIITFIFTILFQIFRQKLSHSS